MNLFQIYWIIQKGEYEVGNIVENIEGEED